jgi:phosphoglycerol transferase MdoB-like AlkP superfamily enzyme
MQAQFNQILNTQKQPFCEAWFTLNSHPPYDIPVPKYLPTPNGIEKDYMNAIHYTDSALGLFWQNAQTQPWFANSLIVIVADHSHDSPKQWDIRHPNRHKIPLFIGGGALQPSLKHTILTHPTSQTHIAYTLLKQLKLPTHDFKFSKSLFSTDTLGLPYCLFGSLGWLQNNQFSTHDFKNHKNNLSNSTQTQAQEKYIQQWAQWVYQSMYQN